MRPTRAAGRKPAPRGRERPRLPPLFGLAPGGVYHAAPVAGDAVRSYRTLSPLPAGPRTVSRAARGGRFAFCGTFPGVTPAGRYPAPCSRGARTFLPPASSEPDAGSGHPTIWRHPLGTTGGPERQGRAPALAEWIGQRLVERPKPLLQRLELRLDRPADVNLWERGSKSLILLAFGDG